MHAYMLSMSLKYNNTHCMQIFYTVDFFSAPSYNLCDHEDDFGTCLFDQDPSSDIGWNFNTVTELKKPV